jgi:hypothetical protein
LYWRDPEDVRTRRKKNGEYTESLEIQESGRREEEGGSRRREGR